jgi:hypothetical protein
MTSQDFAAIEAQIEELDKETACRVARLVVECGAPVPVALLAVQDANTSQQSAAEQKQPQPRQNLMHLFSLLSVRH